MSDVDVGEFVLLPVSADAKARLGSLDIAEDIVDAVITRNIDGTTTLEVTVSDPYWYLVNSGFFDRGEDGHLDAIDVELDNRWWRLVQVSCQSGSNVTLTFEDRVISWLRQHDKPLKVSRKKSTRAEVIKRMVDEVGVAFYSPDLHKAPEQAKAEKPQDKAASKHAKGIASDAEVTVKGVRATAEQRRNMEAVLAAANDEDAPELAAVALCAACITESTFRNLTGGDSTSSGILQLLSTTAAGLHVDARNVDAVARLFLKRGFYGKGGAIALAKAHPDWTPAQIAQAVQGSGTPDGSNYSPYVAEARKIVKAFGGVTSTSKTVESFEFARGTDDQREDSYQAILRLAEEVGWRFFIDWHDGEPVAVFMPEDGSTVGITGLIQAKPTATLNVAPNSPDVMQRPSFDWDSGKDVASVEVTLRTGRYDFSPGSVVALKGLAPMHGRALAYEFSRSLYDKTATVTFSQPLPAKVEPANEVKTVETGETIKVTGSVGRDDLRGLTPKQVIDRIVLPIARSHGINVTPESVAAANAQHSANTTSGNPSDHKGPPTVAWAADMSNGTSPTKQMDDLAEELARLFGFPVSIAASERYPFSPNVNKGGFRFQLGYRTNVGGNHFNHVHFGVHRL